MILVILVYLVLASTFTLAKAAVGYSKPFFLIGFRMFAAGFILLGYLAITNKKILKIKKEDLLLFLKVSVTHVYLTFMCEFWALSKPSMSSVKTSLIFTATPFIAAFLSYLLLGERFSYKKIFGMILGVIGLVPIIIFKEEVFDVGGELLRISLPEVVLMVAVFSAAYAWFDVKKLMDKGYPLLMVNGFAMLVGGLGAFVTSWYAEGFKPSPVSDVPQFLKYTFALVLVSNIIFYNVYGWLLKRYSFTFLSFAGFLTPVFAAFLGWFFLGEAITWHFYASLAIISVALYIYYQDELNFSEFK